MWKSGLLLWIGVLASLSADAKIVIYTDNQHPPAHFSPDIDVVWLDAPEQLHQQRFGQLPADPRQAAVQAQAILQSSQWKTQEQQLIGAYRDVVGAWQLGVRKYPAVVFDDREVVYGTADVANATALREQNQS
ncbi:TIGR03757 family integrating conjugative element protein [Xenorhabdus sp. IM139775]|uniref:TIGR03757 family integrating conjugative element protein n=1 Tax=Xenorhabdus sp. IM139775 TaxID=3025876 RepID=UPI0023587CDB|nr:TIGR03757 family integrating conjugative element protein [Xenorhabdus sp. IM139775]MDC9595185.1 TIGR03757 family integrating conjugative element protein [Xenorhabdus sp. IM139775]